MKNIITCETCGSSARLVRSVLLKLCCDQSFRRFMERYPDPRAVDDDERDDFERVYRYILRNEMFRRAFVCERCYKRLDRESGPAEILYQARVRPWYISGRSRRGRAAVYNYDRWLRFQRRKASEMGIRLD